MSYDLFTNTIVFQRFTSRRTNTLKCLITLFVACLCFSLFICGVSHAAVSEITIGGSLPPLFDEASDSAEVYEGETFTITYSVDITFPAQLEGEGDLIIRREENQTGILKFSNANLLSGILDLEGAVDLGSHTRTFAGIIGSDKPSEVILSDPGEYLILNVPEGEERSFLGIISAPHDSKVMLRKQGKGTQIIGLGNADNADFDIQDGKLVAELATSRKRADACGTAEVCVTNASVTIGDKSEMSFKLGIHPVAMDRNVEVTGPSSSKFSVMGRRASDLFLFYGKSFDNNHMSQTFFGVTSIEHVTFVAIGDFFGRMGGSVEVGNGGRFEGDRSVEDGIIVREGGVLAPGFSKTSSQARLDSNDPSVESIEAGYVLLNKGSSYEVEIDIDSEGWITDSISAKKDYDKEDHTGQKHTGVTIGKDVGLILRNLTGEKVTAASGNLDNDERKVIIKNYKTGRFANVDSSDFDQVAVPVIFYNFYDKEDEDRRIKGVALGWVPLKENRFKSLGKSLNVTGEAVGAAVDELDTGTPVHQAMLTKLMLDGPSSAREALEDISGEIYAVGLSVFLNSSVVIGEMIGDYIHRTTLRDRIYHSYIAGRSAGNRESRDGKHNVKYAALKKEVGSISSWNNILMDFGRMTGGEWGGTKTEFHNNGFALGGELLIAHGTRVGMLLGYTIGAYNIEEPDRDSRGTVGGYYLGSYAVYDLKALELRMNMVFSHHSTSVYREVSSLESIGTHRLRSDYTAMGTRFAAEIANLDFMSKWESGVAEVFGRIETANISSQAFSENYEDPALALASSGGSHSYFGSTVGVRGVLCLGGDCGDPVPRALLLRYSFGFKANWTPEQLPVANMSFLDNDSEYSISGVTPGRYLGFFRLLLDLRRIGDDMSLTLIYHGEVSATSRNGRFGIESRFEL